MAIDVDKLFKTLEEGFEGLERGMTDKSIKLEQRMENMRKRMEDNADKIRRKAERMGQIKTRPRSRSSFRTTFRVIRRIIYCVIFLLMVGYMAVTFSHFLKEQQYKPKILDKQTVEETAKPEKKL